MIKKEEFQWMIAVKQPTDQVKLFDKIARNSFFITYFQPGLQHFSIHTYYKFEISTIK